MMLAEFLVENYFLSNVKSATTSPGLDFPNNQSITSITSSWISPQVVRHVMPSEKVIGAAVLPDVIYSFLNRCPQI